MDPLQTETEDLITHDIEQAEVLNDFFYLSLYLKVLQPSSDGKEKDWGE